MQHTTEMDPNLRTLAATLDGRLVLPGDADWDTARMPWNLAVDQQPAAVAIPAASADDLRRIIAAARIGGFEIAVQPGGHGASSDLRGCILVRLANFDEVTVNVDERYARIGAGVKWGAVLARLAGTGLIALAGTNPDVTAAGYLLSGGHSWFSRWKGLAAHSIRAVEFVDAHGRSRRISADSSAGGDAELLWALRGAAGMLGMVTALEIDLYPAPALFGGKILFPIEAAAIVLDTVAAIMAEAPDELTIFMGLVNMPDAPMVPEPMRGHSFATVDVVFVGDAATAGGLLAPLLSAAPVIANLTQPFDIGHLGEVAAEPTDPMGSLDWNAAVTALGEDGFAPLIEAFAPATPAGLSMVQLRPLGGAIADAAADATGVVGHLDAQYLVFAGAILMDPSRRIDREAVFGPIDRAFSEMTIPRMVPTLLSPGQDLSAALSPEVLTRLGKVKFAVDPDSLFRSNRRLPS
ncbi:FAD-binding oxidoreductase [Cryobacterium tagatosivorans]|uniref:FAD-binding oxidoreductase n=1 Tax=Cryobacterium tagatosivorans TaxID=1259199 RepID=A0A4R8UDD5_9MICO|nr:FAD-binding protein [Cryobacterium tagatosivorans]TFB50292.1 FAD-binding oxidoreductase [Cryobacterium tagatosivorans]